ncbi:MAG: hypothetical protein QW343_00870 [Candidatus Norongarragalinales archaeon]
MNERVSKFLRIQCSCGADAVVFGDSKTNVHCKKCGNLLVRARGGRAKILAKVLEVIS